MFSWLRYVNALMKSSQVWQVVAQCALELNRTAMFLSLLVKCLTERVRTAQITDALIDEDFNVTISVPVEACSFKPLWAVSLISNISIKTFTEGNISASEVEKDNESQFSMQIWQWNYQLSEFEWWIRSHSKTKRWILNLRIHLVKLIKYIVNQGCICIWYFPLQFFFFFYCKVRVSLACRCEETFLLWTRKTNIANCTDIPFNLSCQYK